jgi:branched-chain amino acid aminotransferase
MTVATHVWLNGTLTEAAAAHISVSDRGFQLGDAVFDTLRARRGVPIELGNHLARLRSGLSAMEIALPFDNAAIERAIGELLRAEGWDGKEPPGDAVVRITVSRGEDPSRSPVPSTTTVPTVAIQAWPHRPDPRAERGLRVIVSSVPHDPASPMAAIKTTSRADFVYARLEAVRANADDAIFLTPDGRVTEATTSNVLAIRNGVCSTPGLGAGLLAGTTRTWLIEHSADLGLSVEERDLRLDDLLESDEVALCASVSGITPVVAIDDRSIGGGHPGPFVLALRESRERWIDHLSL